LAINSESLALTCETGESAGDATKQALPACPQVDRQLRLG
jgi:hypothetical protein